MYTITGERYFNDYTRKPIKMNFYSLDGIFDKMKEMSKNFAGEFGNFFPTRKGRDGYEWCSRIECRDYDTGRGWDFWIYQIETDSGIVYSTGRFTDGEKFCSKNVEEWLERCEDKRKNKKHNFVED